MTKGRRIFRRAALPVCGLLWGVLPGWTPAGDAVADEGRVEGTVIEGAPWIVDGDSLRIAGISIRLAGIDAPEFDERCGTEATEALRARAAGKRVRCTAIARDRHNRIVAVCRVGGADVGAALVRGGFALDYRRFTPSYASAEREARAAGRGMHGEGKCAP